jgi:4-amino-4-deoxy-L-arabinose transferase-like glycosyltransferase
VILEKDMDNNININNGCSPIPGDENLASAQQVQHPWLLVVLLVIYHCALGFSFLGSCPLGTHELLVAERTREMIDVGHWMVPHLNGEPSLLKPPAPFWISGGLSQLTGKVDEWAVRIPSVLASVGIMLLIILWMKSITGWRSALMGGFIFATSYAALVWGRRGEVDMQLAFWTTACLVAYWFGIWQSNRRKQVIYFLLMWLSLALAVMTKGPLPLAQFLITVIVMAIMTSPQARQIRRMLPLSGIVILLVVTLPWVIYIIHEKSPSVFLAWYQQTLGRMAGETGHRKPFYFYLIQMPCLLLPWIILIGLGVHLARKEKIMSRQAWIYLLAWGVGGVVFLSLSSGKRMRYALTCVPPFIVFAGWGMDYIFFRVARPWSKQFRAWMRVHGLIVLATLIALIVMSFMFTSLRWHLLILAVIAGIGISLSYWLFCTNRRLLSLFSFGVILLFSQIWANAFLIPQLANLNTNNGVSIGKYIINQIHDTDSVCFYKCPNLKVVFYAESTISIVKEPDELAEWLKTHPQGFIIITNANSNDADADATADADKKQIESMGMWKEIEVDHSAIKSTQPRYCLLQCAGPYQIAEQKN